MEISEMVNGLNTGRTYSDTKNIFHCFYHFIIIIFFLEIETKGNHGNKKCAESLQGL